jgi:hypothetical protein
MNNELMAIFFKSLQLLKHGACVYRAREASPFSSAQIARYTDRMDRGMLKAECCRTWHPHPIVTSHSHAHLACRGFVALPFQTS